MEELCEKEVKKELHPINKTDEYISKRLTKMELTYLRKSKGLSQKDISSMSGLSPKCISDIENNNGGNPTLKSIIKYLECLGFEICFQKKTL